MTLEDILALLQQQGGSSASGGGAASVSKSALGGIPGLDQLGGLLGSLGGGNPSSSDAALGGSIGSGIGTGIGALFGVPFLGGPIGGLLGDFAGSLFGGGVPREAKSASIGTALSGSGNPLEELLGQFVTRGVGQGNVFSQGGSQTFGNAVERIAGMLAALTGQTLPSVTGTGNFQHNPSLAFTAVGGPFGANTFKLPAGYEFASDPSKYSQLFKDVSGAVGEQAPATTKGAQSEWQSVLQQLISQGILQKYAGPLGPVTGGSGVTGGAGGAPNIALPHPLNTNPSKFPGAPYQPGA